MSSLDGNGFTMKEILLEVRDDVRTLANKIDRIDREGSLGTKGELTDHEGRLRVLERFKNAVPTTAALGLIISAAAFVFAYIH